MKRIQTKLVWAAAAAALALTGTTWAATQTETAPPDQMQSMPPMQSQSNGGLQRGTLTAGERNFLQSAAEINATEIETGKLAESQSTDPNIKKIGQDLVRDHTAANQQLEKLASSKGLSITAQPTSFQQRMISSLQQKSGDEFNKQFLRQTTFAHQRAVSMFERASRRAQDPDIKSWAAQMLPSLQSHVAMLKSSKPEAVAEQTEKGKQPQMQGKPSQTHQQHRNPSSGSPTGD